jgi:hypothetical protein
MTTITWAGAKATVEAFLNVSKFAWEIQRSTITICVKNLYTLGSVTYAEFKQELSTAEKSEFSSLVEAHDNSPTQEQSTTLTTSIENENFANFDLSYKMRTFLFTIPNSTGLHTFDISFPYAVMLLGGVVEPTSLMLGDSMQFDSIAKVVVGQLTSACAASDMSVHVNEGAAELIFRAYKLYAVTLDEYGQIVTSALLGEVIQKAGTEMQFAVALTAEQEFAAGTYIAMEFTSVEKVKLQSTNTLWISRDTGRAACMPATTKMQLHYWNTVGGEKEIQIILEIYV